MLKNRITARLSKSQNNNNGGHFAASEASKLRKSAENEAMFSIMLGVASWAAPTSILEFASNDAISRPFSSQLINREKCIIILHFETNGRLTYNLRARETHDLQFRCLGRSIDPGLLYLLGAYFTLIGCWTPVHTVAVYASCMLVLFRHR